MSLRAEDLSLILAIAFRGGVDMNLNRTVAGLEMAHLPKITSSFESSALTLMVPGLRRSKSKKHKVQNTLCFLASASFPFTLTALFRLKSFVALAALAVTFIQATLAFAEHDGQVTKPAPKSYQECVEQGGAITGKVCKTEGGLIFINKEQVKDAVCVDRCGDSVCQELVCMAVGCPCAETAQSCPKDCKSNDW
jgi:hypothetical protein